MMKLVKGIAAFLVLIVLTLTIVGFTTDLSTSIPPESQGKYININGLDIRVLQKGAGPDILLIHGLPGSIEDWSIIINELAESFRVTVYDRPGHGYSQLDTNLANLKGNTQIAFALIEQLGLKDPIVVGHSYGGTITAAMASQQPDNIKGFVSVSGLIKSHKPTDPIYYLLTIPVFGPGFSVLGNQTIGAQMLEQGIREAFHPNENAMPKDFIKTRKSIWLQVKNTLATAYEEININKDLKTINLKTIKHPYYILQGDSDLTVTPENGNILHKGINGSHLRILENTGHFPQYSHPASIIEAINTIARDDT